MLFDHFTLAEVEKMLSHMRRDLEAGREKELIRPQFPLDDALFDEVYDIAHARLRNKKYAEKRLYFSTNDLRFATPEIVARYRAKRLACDTIVDVCSGVGLQSLAFANTCKHVIGIEIDARKVVYAQKNAELLGVTNVTFICGDALDPKVIEQIKKADCVFCDPERAPQEKERTFAAIQPNLSKLVETYSVLTTNVAIELPPFLGGKQIPLKGELEFLGMNGKLNRLTLYCGKLATCDMSCVVLPTEEKLVAAKSAHPKHEAPGKYLYEINTAIVRAGMVAELCAHLGDVWIFRQDKRALTISSDEVLQSGFIKDAYTVLVTCATDIEEIRSALRNNNAGAVVLHGAIDPEKYWITRQRYEDGMTGSQEIHLFVDDTCAVLCTKN